MNAQKNPWIVSLPWYDIPEMRVYTDAFWAHLKSNLSQHFLDLPSSLERSIAFRTQWQSPHLLFSQACSYDLVFQYSKKVRCILNPVYALPGVKAGHYQSYLVVRENSPFQSLQELKGYNVAINEAQSHSGMNVLKAMVTPLWRQSSGRFFNKVYLTGGHRQSLEYIQAMRADVAAVDAVTWRLLERHAPSALSELRILEKTPWHAPSCPYITSRHTTDKELAHLRQALYDFCQAERTASLRAELLLQGVCHKAPEDYDMVRQLAQEYADFKEFELQT